MQVKSSSRAAERRLERREQIVDTASCLFCERGYGNVTLRAIAEKLGYAHAALYRYFPDKASLLAEICRQTFDQLIGELDAQELDGQSYAEGAEAKLLAVSLSFVRFGLAHPHHFQVVFSSPLTRGDDANRHIEAIGRPLFARLMKTFVAGSSAAGLDEQTRALDANTWWISLFGTTHVLINSCDVVRPASRDEVVQRHIQVMWEGFRVLAGQRRPRLSQEPPDRDLAQPESATRQQH